MANTTQVIQNYILNHMSNLTFKLLSSPLLFIADILYSRLYPLRGKYLFVLSTGRCGTNSLERILSPVDCISCFHEPHPQMLNKYPDKINKELYFNFLFHFSKRFSIERKVKTAEIYCETNHMFNKTFGHFAIEQYKDRICLIHLFRNPVEVAYSIYKVGVIPGGSGVGTLWYLNPKDSDNNIQIYDLLSSDQFDHDFYKCVWYWYESEMRTKKIKDQYPLLNIFELDLADINDEKVIRRLFENFNMTFSEDKLQNCIGTHTNHKTQMKKENLRAPDLTVQDQKNMHDKLLEAMKNRYGQKFLK